MKQKLQFGAGTLSFITGLGLFLYYGTRQRPAFGEGDSELREQAMFQDLATTAGVLLILLGIILTFAAAARHWNRGAGNGKGPRT